MNLSDDLGHSDAILQRRTVDDDLKVSQGIHNLNEVTRLDCVLEFLKLLLDE